MSASSIIEWLAGGLTWNVGTGCDCARPDREGGPVCKAHCYAAPIAHVRASNPHPAIRAAYQGLTERGPEGVRWNGRARFIPERLALPLRTRKPSRVFVTSMGDPLHRDITDEQLAAIFGVMVFARWHTYVLASKDWSRMPAWFARIQADPMLLFRAMEAFGIEEVPSGFGPLSLHARPTTTAMVAGAMEWPLPNVLLVASATNQADLERVLPDLLACPGRHGLSLEPLLGDVDILTWLSDCRECGNHGSTALFGGDVADPAHHPRVRLDLCSNACAKRGEKPAPVWVAVGPETGRQRRPCPVERVRDVVEQCREAGVPCFVKALDLGGRVSKDPAEWPADLRVRQYPAVRP